MLHNVDENLQASRQSAIYACYFSQIAFSSRIFFEIVTKLEDVAWTILWVVLRVLGIEKRATGHYVANEKLSES